MLGPRLTGERGVALVPPTLDQLTQNAHWMAQPETTRFWGVRILDLRPERAVQRFTELASDRTSVNWSITLEGELVGQTGLFDINWITRDAESGIFIGRHDLYGRGIASEAIRLRTRYAWDELGLRRVHNWIASRNRGSRRANQKAGYRQIGRFDRSWYRSGQWHDEWLGEILHPEGSGAGEAPAVRSTGPRNGTRGGESPNAGE